MDYCRKSNRPEGGKEARGGLRTLTKVCFPSLRLLISKLFMTKSFLYKRIIQFILVFIFLFFAIGGIIYWNLNIDTDGLPPFGHMEDINGR